MDKSVLIRMRSSWLLGTLAMFYSKPSLTKIALNLFEGISKNNFVEKALKLQTLSIIVKKAGGKLNEKIPEFSKKIIPEINQFCNDD